MKKYGLLLGFLGVLMLCPAGLRAAVSDTSDGTKNTSRQPVQRANELTLREQVGQTIMPRLFIGQQETFKEAVLRGEVTGFVVKSTLPFDKDFLTAYTPEEMQAIFAQERQKLIQTIADLKSWAAQSRHQIPLLFAVDYEGGQITSPLFMGLKQIPSNMLLGAGNDEKIVEQVYAALAQELLQMGANVAFGPDTDVNSNPQNPIIQARSFGGGAAQVGRYAAAAVRATQAQRVAAFIKHFPGHGDTLTDTHKSETHTDLPLKELWNQHISAFLQPIRAGVKGVMSAHVMYKALDKGVNASFSPKVLKNLLQKKLHFKGVIATDGLDMGAVSSIQVEEIVRRAYKAGNHLLLLTSDVDHPQDAPLYARRAADFVVQSTQTQGKEQVSVKEIQTAAQKIIELKKWMQLFEEVPNTTGSAVSFELASRRAAEAGVTLVRDTQQAIPVAGEETAFCNVFFASPIFHYQLKKFSETLQSRGKQVQTVFVPVTIPPAALETYRKQIQTCAENAPVVVVGTSGAAKKETFPEQYALASELIARAQVLGQKAILISLVSPYDIALYPQAKSVMALYGPTEDTAVVAAEIVVGKLEPKGHLPVTLAL